MDKHEVWKALEENLLNLPWIDEIDSHEGFPGGGVPYELKIRCAQFMGSYYNEIGIDEIQLKKLAESHEVYSEPEQYTADKVDDAEFCIVHGIC